MPEYKLKFTGPEDDRRQRTLDDISAFVTAMYGRELAVVTLDRAQSTHWDEVGDFDYQEYYGQEIINQIADGITQTLVVRNCDGLPVALAMRDDNANWRGLGIDSSLRERVANLMHIPEHELC